MEFNTLKACIDTRNTDLVPACDIAVYRNHEKLFGYSSGFSDIAGTKPVGPQDMYFIFSASKVITCTAAMRLVERGLLGLDDPVSRYLPAFRELYVQDGETLRLAKNTLTIRHLFTMTGGFSYNLKFSEILKVKEATGNQATTRQIVDAIAKMPLLFEPGENYQYSLCHDILAAVVEVVSGQTYFEYLSENIFKPVGMVDTTFRLTDAVRARLSAEYRGVAPDATQIEHIEPQCAYALSDRYESGGAGMILTVHDYSLFIDALASGGCTKDGYCVLKPETIDLMRTNQLSGIPLKSFAKPAYGYGLGVRTMLHPEQISAKSPVGEFGWDGAAGAYVMIDPEHHLSMFYVQHVLGTPYPYFKLHPRLRDALYTDLEGIL